jgi:hypothetical protein
MNTILRQALSVAARSLALAAVAVAASSAHAAIILVSKGVIDSGTDSTGVFGAPANLAGKAYKLTITYDDFSTAYHSSSATFEKETGPVTGAVGVAVDGHPFAANVTRSFGAMLYVNDNGAFSELTGLQSGNDAMGQNVYVSHDLSSNAGTVAGPAFAMASYTTQAGDVSQATFRTSGSEGGASFTATPSGAWLVYPPAQLIASLTSYVSGAGLQSGIATSLEAKLNAAQSDLAAGSVASALQDLADLIAESRAQSGKHIPTAQASSIISQTQATIDTIGILYG